MFYFLIKRTAAGFIVLISVVILICSIIYLSPIDPARMSFGQRIDDATLAATKKAYGLDQPLPIQMIHYLRDISPFWINFERQFTPKTQYILLWDSPPVLLKWPHWRESYQSGESVSSILSRAIPKTVILALLAILIGLVFGVLLGILSAIFQDTWIDKMANIIAIMGYSLPSYVAGIFIALIFGYLLSNYTGLSAQGSLVELNNAGDEITNWRNIILPAIALGLRPVALFLQLTKSALLENLQLDYMKTARAKGLSFYKAIYKHCLKNIWVPLLTAAMGWLGSLMAGAFFIESVFNYDGVGDITVNALLNFDIPLALGAILYSATIFIVINILNDILLPFLDPKIKLT